MATDRTEQLIVDLASNLKPVDRLPSVSVRAARWLALGCATAAAAIWGIGLRRNFWAAIETPAVLWSLGLAVLVSASAAMGALRLSVPGLDQSRWTRWLPIAATAAWTCLPFALALTSGVSSSALLHEPFHGACVIEVVTLSALLALFLLRDVRHGAALDAPFTAALAALGSSGLAAVAVQLICPIDRPAHLLVSHVLPAVAFVVLAATLAGARPRVVSRF